MIKYRLDDEFLKDLQLRKTILAEWDSKSLEKEGKFCGFVWFVLPKVMINIKYRVRRVEVKQQEDVGGNVNH